MSYKPGIEISRFWLIFSRSNVQSCVLSHIPVCQDFDEVNKEADAHHHPPCKPTVVPGITPFQSP